MKSQPSSPVTSTGSLSTSPIRLDQAVQGKNKLEKERELTDPIPVETRQKNWPSQGREEMEERKEDLDNLVGLVFGNNNNNLNAFH